MKKLQLDRIDQMTVQELAKLKEELDALVERVTDTMDKRFRDHQFSVTNKEVTDLLMLPEIAVEKLGCHSVAIMRLALLMLCQHRSDLSRSNPLTQDSPWSSDDYATLKIYADMVFKSNLTRDWVSKLVPEKPKPSKTDRK